MDYAQARYYAYTYGRFTSVDPYDPILELQDQAGSDKAQASFYSYLSQVQNWNRYSYVANNPLKYVDPFGEEIRYSNADPDKKLTADQEEALRDAVATLRAQSAVADAFFSAYDKPTGQGPDLDVQVMAD